MGSKLWNLLIGTLENTFVPSSYHSRSWFPFLNVDESFDKLLPENETLFSSWETYQKPFLWVKKQDRKFLEYENM